jgi:type II secretory pathway component PulL
MIIILTLLTILCVILAFSSLHYELKAKKYKEQADAYKEQAEFFDSLLTDARKMMENDTEILKSLIENHYPDIDIAKEQ